MTTTPPPNDMPVTPAQSLLARNEAPHWIGEYLDDCRTHLSEETVLTYQKKLEKFLDWWTGQETMTFFTTALGHRYSAWLAQQSRSIRSQGLSLSAVRAWGTYLVAQGRLRQNPWHHVKGPGKATWLATNFLTFSQIKRLLQAFDRSKLTEHRDYVLAYLMLKSAIRETELSRATVDDLHAQGPYGGMLVVKSKGKKKNPEEPVLLVPKAWNVVQDYLAHRRQGRFLPPKAPLFPTLVDDEERPMSAHDMRRRIRRVYVRAGISTKQFSLLSLRHTAAMHALLKKAPLSAVQSLMRHEDIKTTQLFATHLHRLRASGARFLDHY